MHVTVTKDIRISTINASTLTNARLGIITVKLSVTTLLGHFYAPVSRVLLKKTENVSTSTNVEKKRMNVIFKNLSVLMV